MRCIAETLIKTTGWIFTGVLFFMSCSKSTEVIEHIGIATDSVELKDTLTTLLFLSRATEKPVFLSFGFGRCSPCQKFRKYYNDADVKAIFNRNFILMEIDYDRTPGGKELYKKYGTAGFPSWTILDSDARVLFNDVGLMPGTVNTKINTGYPIKPWALDHYLKSIRISAPGITKDEIEKLAERIEFYGR